METQSAVYVITFIFLMLGCKRLLDSSGAGRGSGSWIYEGLKGDQDEWHSMRKGN